MKDCSAEVRLSRRVDAAERREGSVAGIDVSLAEELNSFFARFEKAKDLSASHTLSLQEHQVRSVFRSVNQRKAADGVPGKVLRACADQLSTVFTKIFNLSLTQSTVPHCPKSATTIPAPPASTPTSLPTRQAGPLRTPSQLLSTLPYVTRSILGLRLGFKHDRPGHPHCQAGRTGLPPGLKSLLRVRVLHWFSTGLCVGPSPVHHLHTRLHSYPSLQYPNKICRRHHLDAALWFLPIGGQDSQYTITVNNLNVQQ